MFSRETRRRPSKFIGTDNYTDLFADPTFLLVVKNNLIYAAVTIPVSIGIVLAMALGQIQKFLPGVCAYGVFYTNCPADDRGRKSLAVFTHPARCSGPTDLCLACQAELVGQPETALWAVIIGIIWKEGLFMIFYLAALQTIPPDLKEAADIEGAEAGGPIPAALYCRS